MQIIVLLKQILDPEVPAKEFQVDPATYQPVPGTARLVVDSYAENALETAIQLRDGHPGSKVTALCLGDKSADEVLRRALGFTADAAVRVWEPVWAGLDGLGVARVLAGAVRALGGADLILAGRQAGDVEEGLVGPALAEELGFACATIVSKVEVAGERLTVTREDEDGYAVLSLPTPAVLSVTSSERNVPRLPKVKDTMLAMRKPIRVLGAAETGLAACGVTSGMRLVEARLAASDVHCEIIAGDGAPEQAHQLVRKLQAMKLLTAEERG